MREKDYYIDKGGFGFPVLGDGLLEWKDVDKEMPMQGDFIIGLFFGIYPNDCVKWDAQVGKVIGDSIISAGCIADLTDIKYWCKL